MYSVIKYQGLELCYQNSYFSQNAAYKSSKRVVEMTGIEPATP